MKKKIVKIPPDFINSEFFDKFVIKSIRSLIIWYGEPINDSTKWN